MSDEGSNKMVSLLKELSVYNAMDENYKGGAKGSMESEGYEQRKRRRQEIKQEMHSLAVEKNGTIPHEIRDVLIVRPTIFKGRNQLNGSFALVPSGTTAAESLRPADRRARWRLHVRGFRLLKPLLDGPRIRKACIRLLDGVNVNQLDPARRGSPAQSAKSGLQNKEGLLT